MLDHVFIRTVDNFEITGIITNINISDDGHLVRTIKVEKGGNLEGQEIDLRDDEIFLIVNVADEKTL